jgi:hypothetical protein
MYTLEGVAPQLEVLSGRSSSTELILNNYFNHISVKLPPVPHFVDWCYWANFGGSYFVFILRLMPNAQIKCAESECERSCYT